MFFYVSIGNSSFRTSESKPRVSIGDPDPGVGESAVELVGVVAELPGRGRDLSLPPHPGVQALEPLDPQRHPVLDLLLRSHLMSSAGN